MSDRQQLRELHDAYVWQVNAAVGMDRLDLARELVDDFTDQAVQLLSEGEPPGCARTDCAVCARSPRPARARRHRWLRWLSRS